MGGHCTQNMYCNSYIHMIHMVNTKRTILCICKAMETYGRIPWFKVPLIYDLKSATSCTNSSIKENVCEFMNACIRFAKMYMSVQRNLSNNFSKNASLSLCVCPTIRNLTTNFEKYALLEAKSQKPLNIDFCCLLLCCWVAHTNFWEVALSALCGPPHMFGLLMCFMCWNVCHSQYLMTLDIKTCHAIMHQKMTLWDRHWNISFVLFTSSSSKPFSTRHKEEKV